MTYDREYVYVTWGGHLGTGGQEIWQNGVKLAATMSGDTPAFPNQTQGQTLMATMQTNWVLPANLTGSSCFLRWVKFAHMTTAGKLKGEALYIPTNPSTGIAAPTGTNPHPWQISACMTLWSGESYGKGNYGRAYLPDPRFNIGADGLIAGTNQNYVNWFGSWVKSIEASAATWAGGTSPLYVHVMHGGSALNPGISRRVSKIRMGNVLDTQRRRRNKLFETYTNATTYP